MSAAIATLGGASLVRTRRLGRVDYAETVEAMRAFTTARGAASADELWLLEHPPVYTLGQGADAAHGPRSRLHRHSDRATFAAAGPRTPALRPRPSDRGDFLEASQRCAREIHVRGRQVLAQLLDAEAACRLAVYLHGLAGDLAEADEGEVAMTSADVAAHLGELELLYPRTEPGREDSLTKHGAG